MRSAFGGAGEDGLRRPMAALGDDEQEHDKCQHVAPQARRAGTRRQKTSLSHVSVAVAQLMRPLPPDLVYLE